MEVSISLLLTDSEPKTITKLILRFAHAAVINGRCTHMHGSILMWGWGEQARAPREHTTPKAGTTDPTRVSATLSACSTEQVKRRPIV